MLIRPTSLFMASVGAVARRATSSRRANAPTLAARRRGFTLLEMLLATFVSVLLMGALYVAMDVQIRHARAGRDVIEQSTLARALKARITNEIMKCVTTVAPAPAPPLSTPPKDGSTPAAGSSAGAPTS